MPSHPPRAKSLERSSVPLPSWVTLLNQVKSAQGPEVVRAWPRRDKDEVGQSQDLPVLLSWCWGFLFP